MPIDILMPQLSPTMTEGRLANWLKAEGDSISAGEVIAEVETDKATMEVEATDDGVLHKVLEDAGKDIQVGVPIAILKEEGEDVPADYQPTSKAAAPAEAAPAEAAQDESAPAAVQPAAAPAPASLGAAPAAPVAQKASGSKPTAVPAANGDVKASPVAKRIAQERGLDLSQIIGSGPHGRVIKRDVENAVPGAGSRAIRRYDDQEVSLSPMRKAIAQRLTQSKQYVPHFYLTDSVAMDNLLAVRAQINAAAPVSEEGKPGHKVSVNDLIIKASAMALAAYPAANSAWANDKVIQFGNVDVSVAVSIEGGLITPILENADQKGVVALSQEMKSLAKRARAGELQPEEYEGGSFSVSNLGMFGVKTFSAIINPPQAAILACGKAEARAVVNANGQLVSAQVMDMTLSVDHRVIDGALGAELLAKIKFYLENPAAMLV